jgi:CheY-like chemotaxis protein
LNGPTKSSGRNQSFTSRRDGEAGYFSIKSSFLNLAVNARDAMPDGGKLTIETGNAYLDDRYAYQHAEVTAGQYVLISVSDSGIGMGTAVIEKAFEPFYTTKGVGKGSRLGLSQVFGFVKQTGGHVKIYSEVGEGTTVKIYLPRHVGASVLVETGPEEVAPQGEPDEIILVVEDEAKVRRMTVDSLRDLGYTVVHAGSGREALRALEIQESVALLFTDIVMPEMSGRELADRALKNRPDLKVLYTTGYTRNAVVHNGIVDPGTAFLQKPFTLQLAAKVRQTIAG